MTIAEQPGSHCQPAQSWVCTVATFDVTRLYSLAPLRSPLHVWGARISIHQGSLLASDCFIMMRVFKCTIDLAYILQHADACIYSNNQHMRNAPTQALFGRSGGSQIKSRPAAPLFSRASSAVVPHPGCERSVRAPPCQRAYAADRANPRPSPEKGAPKSRLYV